MDENGEDAHFWWGGGKLVSTDTYRKSRFSSITRLELRSVERADKLLIVRVRSDRTGNNLGLSQKART